jgi:hypothetical protein
MRRNSRSDFCVERIDGAGLNPDHHIIFAKCRAGKIHAVERTVPATREAGLVQISEALFEVEPAVERASAG